MTEYLPDIYKISETIKEIQSKFIEEEENTLELGIYGYLNEVFANSLQNAILLASEYGNEAIPIRSKYERTIMTNAVTYDVQDINAKPAKMTVMIGFVKQYLDKYLDKNKKFVLDRYCDIKIGTYVFHLDYDIEINRSILMNKNVVYSAKYNMNFVNNLSDITNPYLQSPIIMNIQGDDYLFIICDIRQTELEITDVRILSNNVLESKSFDFSFSNQLASFNVYVTENDETIELIPVYEGMPYNKDEYYCYYTYIDSDRIRVKFDRDSYQPALNCDVKVEVYNTLGEKGNFEYGELSLLPLVSEDYDYKTIKAIIQPMNDSTNGVDKKSVDDLQKIIPKRILARGGIINTKDLQNYFDMIDVNNRLIVYKKRFNQLEHLYYAYLISKDSDGNVSPTNTIDIKMDSSEFDSFYDDRYIIKPGRKIYYDKNMYGYYTESKLNRDESNTLFTYTSPFITVINKNPLSISYYLDIVNREYIFNYDYINQESVLQFIATKMAMYKNYLYGDDYIFTMNVTQNISTDKGVAVYIENDEVNDNGEVVNSKDKVIDHFNLVPVLCVTSGNKKYYTIGDITNYNPNSYSYELEFRFSSDVSLITKDNKVQISGLTANNENDPEEVFINRTVNISVYLYLTNEVEDIKPDLKYNDDLFIPQLEEKAIIVNKYIIKENVELFYNYSATINSVCEVTSNTLDEGGNSVPDSYNFELKSIPVVRHQYIQVESRLNEFIEYIQYRKNYIDMAQEVLEDSFNVDLKFFNTYGPSKLFTVGRKGELLDRLNLSLEFIVKLDSISDIDCIADIKDDIKSYIEDINNISSLHMSNICHYIKQQYEETVVYIEFVRMNGYDSTYQYIERRDPDIMTEIPEFITIDLESNEDDDILVPDINIIVC